MVAIEREVRTANGSGKLRLLPHELERRELLEPMEVRVPDPVVGVEDRIDPEQQALLADLIGLALQVVLEMLAPAERLAFVLHDMFGVPFDQIAVIVDRSPEAARQLASRARRRVQCAATPDTDLAGQRAVVDAFQAARDGDFDALLAVLDPDVVLRADAGVVGTGSRIARGAQVVASGAIRFASSGPTGHRAGVARSGCGMTPALTTDDWALPSDRSVVITARP
jgi:Sigma-70, region 4